MEKLDNFCALRSEVEQISGISMYDWDFFCTLLRRQSFQKGQHFVQAGQNSEDIGFVEKGLFRIYYHTFEGEQSTTTLL